MKAIVDLEAVASVPVASFVYQSEEREDKLQVDRKGRID